MSKRLEFLTVLTDVAPNISLHNALRLAHFVVEPNMFDLTTHEGRVACAKNDPEIQAFVFDDRKIQAIKALRQRVLDAGLTQPHSGLLACKNAIDEVMPRRTWLPTPPPPTYTSPGYNDYDEPPF